MAVVQELFELWQKQLAHLRFYLSILFMEAMNLIV
jgi:hypothetical protein